MHLRRHTIPRILPGLIPPRKAVRFIIYAIDVFGEKTIFTGNARCIRLSDAKSFIELPRGSDAHKGGEMQDEATSLRKLTVKTRGRRMRYAALSCALLLCGTRWEACALFAQSSAHPEAHEAGEQKKVGAPTEVLYGAAYYHEYEPYERLDQDIAMMKKAGLNVVRMGESTWSLWEPEDGTFEYAWMDRVVDAMGKAGIKVIMGTPTYSIPTWMYREHPEILVRPLGGAKTFYGMRQNMDTDNADYRRYAKRLITNLVEHYKNNPYVIGWQIDNETASYGASNDDVFAGFVKHLKEKFGTTDNLNKRWFLNYWGEDVNGWEDLPKRDRAQSTGYKLEWSRWEQMRVTDFLAWQAELVREHRGPQQFVTTD